MLTNIYKTSLHEGMYLYVASAEKLNNVPAALLQRFPEPELVMTIELQPEKKLARANAADVLSAIEHQGYYLQVSKERDLEMIQVAIRNDKLHGT